MNIARLNKIYVFFFFLGISTGVNAQTFTDVTIGAGITDPDNTKLTHDGGSATDVMGLGSGAAWLDYNNDGLLDLYVTMRTGANKLYKNNGGGTFTDVAASLGVQDASGDGAGVVIGDINNDGWQDIFLNNCHENKMYKNNGGTFTDITVSSGLHGILGDRRGTSATFGDYDKDGYLDLYISHHFMTNGTQAEADRKDFLIHNDGDETFTDVSSLLEYDDLISFGFIGGWTDYDQDGDLDIIVVNDCENTTGTQYDFPTKVFRNDGGTDAVTDWTFTEVGDIVGIDDCRNGMGIAVGDYDHNGWQDVFYTNIGEVVLFSNTDGLFTDSTSEAGVGGQATLDYSWGATFVDYDLDGWQDIYVTLGELQPFQMDNKPNQMFKNNGDGSFTNLANSLGIDNPRKSRNAIFGDYDNDGDLDLFLVNYGGEFSLYRNDVPGVDDHYFIVKPQGTQSNMDGIGTKVEIVYGDPDITQIFEVRSGSNLGGGEEIGAFFGLGSETTIDSVIVTFLSGEEVIYTDEAADQVLTVLEPDGALAVDLGRFDARRVEKQVDLNWITLSETNNAKFLIERSADGRNYATIGEVAGKGSTTIATSYDFVDVAPLQGSNYYRLQQVDFDGKASFSEVRIVDFIEGDFEVAISPNPVTANNFRINYNGNEEEVNYELLDVFGKKLQSGLIQNNIAQKIDTNELPNGMYILQLSGKLIHHTEKILISK